MHRSSVVRKRDPSYSYVENGGLLTERGVSYTATLWLKTFGKQSADGTNRAVESGLACFRIANLIILQSGVMRQRIMDGP